MDSTLAYFIIGLLAIGVAVWRVKVMNAVDTTHYDFSDAFDDYRRAVELVEKFAPAVDQLVKIKELEPEQRRAEVIEKVTELLPNIDPDTVRFLVEWWVATQKHAVAGD